MGNIMQVSDLIKADFNENSAYRYIDYYFHQMVGLNQKKQIYFDKIENAYISIMKDEVDRKLSGTGRLREKPWSNFLFYFVDLNDYKHVFGTNAKHRNLESITSDGCLNLTRYD